MSDQHRVTPVSDSLDSAPTAPDLSAPNSSMADVAQTPTPPAEVGARRRSRLSLRIPDDEVARPPVVEPDPSPIETSREDPVPVVAAAEGDSVLTPTRIITISPPPTAFPAVAPPPSDDGLDDEPTPLVRRIQRGPMSTPLPTQPVTTLSFASVQGLPSTVPVQRPAPQSFPPLHSASVQSTRAPSFPPAYQRAPTPVPVPLAPATVIPSAPPGTHPAAAEARSDPGDGELSLDDLVAFDATPSSPRVSAAVPAARPRLPSHPPVPPTPKKGSAERPSKPPLVIVPPHMGSVAPQQTDGSVSRRKGRFWWEDLFNDDYLRATERLSEEQLAREVDFIEESLGIERGGAVLDLACGTGRHAIDLARRGYRVVAFDLSLAMLARAGDEAQERGAQLNFVQGDMREMTFVEQFDGVYCWNTSFGFFEEDKNALVVGRVHRSLKAGGLFLLDVINRDFVIRQSPSLAWFEGDGCVCMDEMVVDFIASRMRIKRTMMVDDGRSREIEFSMRVYSLHELGKMLHDHGFKVCEVSGRISTPGVFFGHESPRTIILAEKR
jgi:SAM-dependent methyltransferase